MKENVHFNNQFHSMIRANIKQSTALMEPQKILELLKQEKDTEKQL